jgi:hypothetical protein
MQMLDSRREFLTVLCAACAPLGVVARTLAAQHAGSHPQPMAEQKTDDANAPKVTTKTILQANDKDLKKNVEKLYELASELKTEVEKTNSVQVLSLPMLKKAEEIEKLAKEIKSLAKG